MWTEEHRALHGAGWAEFSERFDGRGVGAAGAGDPAGETGRASAQDRHAGGDERHPLPAADRLSVALPAA